MKGVSGAMRLEAVVLGVSALLLVSIIFFPAPFHRVSMIHAIHLAEESFNQRFDHVTELRMHHIRFDGKVWRVVVTGIGYRDGEYYSEGISVSVHPVTGHTQVGVVVGDRLSCVWMLANRVSTVPSSMVVHNVTSEDLRGYTGVVMSIDREFRETGPNTGITDVPNIEDRWNKMPLSEALSFMRFFGEEITEGKNVYIVFLRFIGDIYSILIRLN